MSFSPLRHVDSIFWKRKPVHVTFFVTKICNAACPFCFYIWREDGPAPGELTLPEIEKVADSLPNLLWLAFSGGEIFVRKDFAEIVETFYRKNKPVVMLFPTNGIMTEKIVATMRRLCASCPQSRIVCKISLDGPPDYHDKMRVVKGCYEKAMKTYHGLVPLLEEFENFDLGVNTVLCEANQDLVDGFIDTVAETMPKITTHTVSLARGDMPSPELKNVQLEKYKAAVLKLEERVKNGKLPVYRFPGGKWKAAQDIVQRQLIFDTAQADKRLSNCYAGTLNLVLAANGDLHPCEEFSMHFGNVKDHGYDVTKVLQTEQAKQILADIKAWKCHCTHECFMMTNTLFNPRLIPKIAREYIKLRPAPTVQAARGGGAPSPSPSN